MKIGASFTVDALALKWDTTAVTKAVGENLKERLAYELFGIVQPERLYTISTSTEERENPNNFTHEFKMMADVNEIVRCKDCEFKDQPIEIAGHKFLPYCKNLQRFVDDEWFCGDGERREENED